MAVNPYNPFGNAPTYTWDNPWKAYKWDNPQQTNPYKTNPWPELRSYYDLTSRYIMNEIVKTSGSDTSGMIAGLPVIVLDLLEHMNEDKVTTVVAGGYCTDYFMDYKNKRGDIDLFFDSKESVNKAQDFLKENLLLSDWIEKGSKNALTFIHKKEKAIQLITRNFFYCEETQVFHKQALFNSFDFECCCCLVTILPNGKEIGYYTTDFQHCIDTGITTFTQPWTQNILARESYDNFEATMTLTKRLPKMNAKGLILNTKDFALLLSQVIKEMNVEITQKEILESFDKASNVDAYEKPSPPKDELISKLNLSDADLLSWFEKHKYEIYDSHKLPHGMVSGAWSSNSSSAMTQFIDALQRDKGFAYEAIRAYLNKYPRSKNDSPYISFAIPNYTPVSYDYNAMDSAPMIDTITMTFDELGDILKKFDLYK